MFDDNQFIAFRQHYQLTHPSSVPALVMPDKKEYQPHYKYRSWLRYVNLAILISASLLAGVHTVGVVYDGITVGPIITEFIRRVVSILSFCAVELSIFISAYIMDKKRNLAVAILIVGFLVSMAANIFSVFAAFATVDTGGRLVAVLLGVGAPLMALLAGAMYEDIDGDKRIADQAVEARFNKAKRDAETTFQNRLAAYDEAVLGEYNTWLARTERRSRTRVDVSKEVSNRVQNGQIGQGFGQPSNVQSLPENVPNPLRLDARTRVIQHLEAFPMDISLPVRELETKIGVSKSTISDVIKTMRNAGQDGQTTP